MLPQITLPDLPVREVLPTLLDALSCHHDVILEAPPGAGKTTLVPLALLDQVWLGAQRILLLEPRRMAARNAARRMASLLGEKVGETIGYRIRQESCIGPHTRIEVITEGILNRILLDDPALSNVGAIIFDEFHERSLDADTGLALTLQGRALFREDLSPLKLIVMSATLNAGALSSLLPGAALLRSEGKAYPVTLHYGEPHRHDGDIVKRITGCIRQCLVNHSGSLLVFLPGRREIDAVQKQLLEQLDSHTTLCPLYGGLPLASQQLAIEPAAGEQRKVVLATDIAESSLTIEGIEVVIDSGLHRQPRFDPNTGMTRLYTQRISQDASEQRAGRAGRLSAGHCYRLWTEQQQSQLAPHRAAEILHADLAPLLLLLIAWGIDDMQTLDWLDSPPRGATLQALQLLQQLEAIAPRDRQPINTVSPQPYALGCWLLTTTGEKLAALPMHPRLAHMLLRSCHYALEDSACALASLLNESGLRQRDHGADLGRDLGLILTPTATNRRNQAQLQQARQQAQRFRQLLARQEHTEAGEAGSHNVLAYSEGFLIACAYPDRVARRRTAGANQYQLANGQVATLHPDDALNASDWLAVAEVGGINRSGPGPQVLTIFSAAAMDIATVKVACEHLVDDHTVLAWDTQSGRFIAHQQSRLGKLVITQQALAAISPEQKCAALLETLREQGMALLPWDDNCRQWQARVQLLRQLEGDSGEDPAWPDVSDQHLLATLEAWLMPYLTDINRLSDFKRLPLENILSGLLPWPLPQRLQQLAPTSIEVPSGARHRIDYRNDPPILSVKLQEMFGCTRTPCIADGKVSLLVHLLSPAGRPLQVTQDLNAFWNNAYQEVKREMRGRYPKHPWPDDPLAAVATRFSKRRS